MSKPIRIIIAIVLFALVFFIIYLVWQGLSFLAVLIPWYISLISFSTGCIMYFFGRHFVKKKNVFRKKEDKIILSTPIQADLLIIFGVIIMIISAFTSKLFFSTGSEDYIMKGFSVLFLIIGVVFIVLNFLKLKHSLNDRIEICKDEFRFDNPLGKDYTIYKKNELYEIVLLKEFEDTRGSREKLINSGNPLYYSNEYKLTLSVKLKPLDEKKESSAEKLNPEDMRIDLSIFVEALESMDYSIVRRSKYDCSDQLWEGHNFEEGFLFKD
ncbi:MAG: hypothetical protein FJZ67_07590 [Bacteroidetes bacterium]|nr:hypothetical protein [Bacteroidota bacterium]